MNPARLQNVELPRFVGRRPTSSTDDQHGIPAGSPAAGNVVNYQTMQGVVYTGTNTGTTTSGSAATLDSFTLGQNAIDANGKGLLIEAYGTTGAGTAAKTINLNVGGTVLATFSPGAASGKWGMRCALWRTGAATGIYEAICWDSNAGKGPLIHSNGSNVTNSAAATAQSTFTIPANTLAADGDALRLTAWGTTSSGTTLTAASIQIGGTTVATIAPGTSSGSWMAQAILHRTGAATCVGVVDGRDSGGGSNTTHASGTPSDCTAAWAANQTARVLLAANAEGAVVSLKGFTVELLTSSERGIFLRRGASTHSWAGSNTVAITGSSADAATGASLTSWLAGIVN